MSDPLVRDAGLLAPRKIAIQLLGFVVGLSLLAWCIRSAVRGGGWERLADADLRLVAAMLACSLGSQLLNGAAFWVTIRPVKKIPLLDLEWLNVTCGMLNYAPIRLGALGRILYHVRVDGLGLLQIAGWFTFILYTVALAVASCIVATLVRDQIDLWWFLLVLGQVALGGIVTRVLVDNPIIVRHGRGINQILAHRVGVWSALAFRLLDLGMFAARMAIALRILGIELPAAHVVVLALVALAGSLIPIGRLGFREFCVAITAERLSMMASDVESNMQQLALVESAGEAAVLIPVGAIGLLVMRKRWRAARANTG